MTTPEPRDPIKKIFDEAEVILPPGGGDDLPPVDACAENEPARRAAREPRNDEGNARRLIIYFGDDFLHVPRLGWFRWDGRRWASDEDEIQVRQDARRVSRRIRGEIPYLGTAPNHNEEDGDKKRTLAEKHAGWALTIGNSGRITNMLAEARADVSVSVEDLNADPWMICCESGVPQFAREPDPDAPSWRNAERPVVRVLPFSRQHRITKMARAKYHPRAMAPTWRAFLDRVQPDPELQGFIKRWFGYIITGLTTEQKLAFFFGQGRNGKSTAVDVIARIMADYSTTLPIESLT